MRKLLLLSLLLPLSTLAQDISVRYQAQVIGSRGVPLANQNVAVCTQPAVTTTQPCSPLATLATSTSTSSGGTNPLTTDSLGNFFFYAAPGKYTIQIYGPQVGTPFVQPDTILACSPTGNCTITATITLTTLNVKTIENVRNVDQWCTTPGTLDSTCFSNAAAANTKLRVPSGTYTLTANLSFSQNYLDIECDSGAQINTTASASFNFSGAHQQLHGCLFNGPGTGAGGGYAVDLVGGSSYFKLYDNHFQNYPSGSTCTVFAPDRSASVASPVSFVWVQRNHFVNSSGTALCSYDQVDHVWIDHNWVDFSAATTAGFEGIIVHAQDASTQPTYVHVTDNKGKGGTGNLIEVGAFGGTAPQWVDVSHNECTITAQTTGSTCFSLSSVTDFAYSFNIANAANFFPQGNQLIECVDCIRGSITGNVANMGTQSGTAPQGAIGVGTNAGSTLDVVVSGNVVNMSFTNATGIAIAYFSGITTPTSLSRVTYVGNTANLSGSTGKNICIDIQANNASATVQNNYIQGNTCVGASIAGDSGITLERDAGTMTHNFVGPNQVINFTTLYNSNGGTPTNGFCAGCTDPVPFATTLAAGFAASSDIGSTLLPFANLWLGTAATNNFKLQPAATAAARVISMPDPLGNVNLPYIIVSGTSTMTSGAVTAATCQAAVTTSATGTATTDSIEWSYATAPTLTTDALLHVSPFVTANNVNFTRCNPTSSSITGTAIVINWRVVR